MSKPRRKQFGVFSWLLLAAGLLVFVACCCVPLAMGGFQFAMQQAGLLPTFTPRPTATVTPVPAATLPPTPTAEPTRPPLIADVPAILGRPVAEVGPQFGQPAFITPHSPGSLESIPEGGQVHTYDWNGFVVSLGSDPAGLVRWFSIEGLEGENYALRDHRLLLRLNLDPPGEPDRTAAAALHWDNSDGLYIGVFSALDRPVNMVNVWQVR